MNKIKLVFTAAAVFAVVGSSMALTKSYGIGNRFCRTQGGGATSCSTLANFSTVNPNITRQCSTTFAGCQSSPVATQVRLVGE